MKRNRLFFIVYIYIGFYLLRPTGVEAYTMVSDECLDKNECMLVCNYNNTYKGNNNNTRQRNISLYYVHKNEKWILKWEGTNENRTLYKKGPDSFNTVFSKSGENVYTSSKLSADEFACPKYVYLDMSALNPDNEICFDNDGKYCEERSNVGTAFGKKADKFKNTKKDYDVLNDVKKYFQNWVVGDLSCEALAEKADNIDATIKEKVAQDFQKNFMKSKATPKFILGSSAYKTSVEQGVNNKKSACISEIDEKVRTGKMDAKKGEQLKNKIRGINPGDVQDAVDDARDKIASDSKFSLDQYNKPQNCNGIFGDPTDTESLAYIIQKILDYIKIIGPILVVVLSSIDFVKVIWSSDDESMKKAQQKLVKRLVAAVLLFLLPVLIDLMFNLINDSIVDPTCGIK